MEVFTHDGIGATGICKVALEERVFGRRRLIHLATLQARPSVVRITLTLLMTEQEIVLLDIGSHDEVYR
jgi:hypothetical protein